MPAGIALGPGRLLKRRRVEFALCVGGHRGRGAAKGGRIVLFSPMIGINPLAKMTRLYHTVGLVSRNPKTKWSSVYAEIDPFKYSSWPMNANVQAWAVPVVERKLAALEKSGNARIAAGIGDAVSG